MKKTGCKNNGGARKGAGRKKGQISIETKRKQIFERLLIERIHNEKKDLIDALMLRAKTGDVKALTEVFNRMIGKSMEHIDHTTNGESIGTTVSFEDGDIRLLISYLPKNEQKKFYDTITDLLGKAKVRRNRAEDN